MKTAINLLFCFILLVTTSAYAEVTTDGTVGNVQNLSGQMTIPQSLGTTVGNNLFHSFSMFNINTGESATFTGSDSLKNVISRVTGGNPSFIDGLLQSTIKNANFYFINPAGMTFGANAKLDVPAAFHVSTADALHFADGSQFNATNPAASTLSIAEPASFGFVGTASSNIEIKGAQLAVKTGQTLDVVAGNITVTDQATLSAPAGEIRLVAIKGTESVSLERTGIGALPLPTQSPTASNGGTVAVAVDASTITTQGDGGGRIALWSSEANFNNKSTLSANNDGDTNAGFAKGIEINALNVIANNNTQISSDSVAGSGKAGDVNVTAGTLDVLNGSQITADTYSKANGSNIDVKTHILKIDGLSSNGFTGISVSAMPGSSGNAGDVSVAADTLDILNSVSTYTDTSIKDDRYSGGNIASYTFGTGNAGNIDINAQILNMRGTDLVRTGELYSVANTAINSDTMKDSSGNAGNVSVNADTLNISNSANISSSTASSGNGGDVKVIAKDLTINGENNPYVTTIYSATGGGTGNAGSVYVKADNIALLNAGTILGNSFGTSGFSGEFVSGGDAANITVEANSIKIDGQGSPWWTGIASDLPFGSNGDAGDVVVNTNTLEILNGDNSFISSASLNGDGGSIPAPINSNGNPGNVIINALQSVYLDHGKIRTSTIGSGLGGTIQLNSPLVTLNNGSEISATSIAEADSGNINITASTLNLLNNSKVTVANTYSGNAGGNAGDITINDSQLIYLQDSGLLTSVSGANSNGGNINVTADLLVMNTGVIQANAIGGSGGDINLNLKALIPSQDTLIKGGTQVTWQPYIPGFNVIQAASAKGVSGTINLTSPQFNISGAISGLNATGLVSPVIDRNPCQGAALDSSLTHSGKGGIPATESNDVFVSPISFQQSLPDFTLPTKLEIIPLAKKGDNQPCAAIPHFPQVTRKRGNNEL